MYEYPISLDDIIIVIVCWLRSGFVVDFALSYLCDAAELKCCCNEGGSTCWSHSDDQFSENIQTIKFISV